MGMTGADVPIRTIVAVEGFSDEAALLTLADRRKIDLSALGVRIAWIGGAHGIGRFLAERPRDVAVAGLCDAGEEHVFRRALERSGFGASLTREEMERVGFYVCEADLEDELIRSHGTEAVETILEREDDLDRFRMFQHQPAQRDRPLEAQLHRFLRTTSGRNVRYARVLIETLDAGRFPRPLNDLLTHLTKT
ncbi:MAG: ATP-dependent endonuclease [Gaiellaceae bacterium]|jgi:hypothetical protein